MTELWAVIGLAMLDGEFNKELKAARDDLKELGEEVEEYGFQLSCYELVELQRIISTKLTDFPEKCPEDVLDLLYFIFSGIWVIDTPCWWAWWKAALNPDLESLGPKRLAEDPKLALNPKYQHPYLVFDQEMQMNVPGAVDPKTGEPISKEELDTKVTDVPGNGSVTPRRFVKAKHPKKARD